MVNSNPKLNECECESEPESESAPANLKLNPVSYQALFEKGSKKFKGDSG